MAAGPLRPCPVPRCPALVQRGKCPEHAKAHYEQQDKRRGTSTQRGYDSDWRRLRASHLAEHPLCVDHLERGMVVLAREVDHIVPIAQGGGRLDPANLQSLCKPCHSRKTMAESVTPQ